LSQIRLRPHRRNENCDGASDGDDDDDNQDDADDDDDDDDDGLHYTPFTPNPTTTHRWSHFNWHINKFHKSFAL